MPFIPMRRPCFCGRLASARPARPAVWLPAPSRPQAARNYSSAQLSLWPLLRSARMHLVNRFMQDLRSCSSSQQSWQRSGCAMPPRSRRHSHRSCPKHQLPYYASGISLHLHKQPVTEDSLEPARNTHNHILNSSCLARRMMQAEAPSARFEPPE